MAEYIYKHHYLPGIDPASTEQKNCLDLGSRETQLLQKIEELTLYVIEQSKKIEAQDKQILEISRQIKK